MRSAVKEYFGIDGRLWATMRLLVLRPGELTADHIQGRRARYVAPLRLYLSATVLFFFLLSVLDPVSAIESRVGMAVGDSTISAAQRIEALQREIEAERTGAATARKAARDAARMADSLMTSFRTDSTRGALSDSASTGLVSRQIERATREAQQAQEDADDPDTRVAINRRQWQIEVLETYPPDSTIRAADLSDASALLFPDPDGSNNFNVTLLGSSVKSTALQRFTDARTATERRRAISDLGRSAIGRVPVVMFFLLPVFALIMKLVYVRRNWYYSEHLVFALHNHAVSFFGFSLIAILLGTGGSAPWVEVSNLVLIFGMNVYFFLAMRRVYGQGWIKTGLKYLLVSSWYWIAILFFGVTLILLLAATVG